MTEPKRYEMNGTVRLGRRKKMFFFGKKCCFFGKKCFLSEKMFFSGKKCVFSEQKCFFSEKKCFFSEKNVFFRKQMLSVWFRFASRNDNTVIVSVGLADNPPPEFTEDGHYWKRSKVVKTTKVYWITDQNTEYWILFQDTTMRGGGLARGETVRCAPARAPCAQTHGR